MTNELLGIILFLAFIVGGSILAHRKIYRIWLAALLTAVGASLLLQIIGYAHLGYLDPFYEIAFVNSLFWGLLASFFIGYIMHKQGKAAVSKNAT